MKPLRYVTHKRHVGIQWPNSVMIEEQPSTSIHYHHHQNSAETQTGEGCIPPSWQAQPGGFGTTAFRPQQAQRTHAQETKNRSFPNVSPVVRRTRQPSMFFRYVTDTNQSESHSCHQQLRFTRNYMGAWRTWRRPPTSSLLLDWSCKRTRRRSTDTCICYCLHLFWIFLVS